MRHRDHLVAEAEGEQRLGRRRDEARDAHDRNYADVVERLSDGDIDSRLSELEGWVREDDAIVKTFKLADFVGSVEFVDKMVHPAEEMGHHPDLSISWNEVRVSITTHAAGGLTANDFELARRIDRLGGGQRAN
jgi:4a-hydroxytetrahydrobiopterin dehydratase